jgi:hypothetical protein
MKGRATICCRAALLAGLIAGTASLGRAGPAAEKRPRSALEGVTALEQPVTHTATKVPLGELVQHVAAETGVPLAAAAEVADEPVAVVVNGLPARELLEQLAELLDYTWSRRRRQGAWHYEIYQDLASKQRQAVLLQAALGDVERHLRRELARYLEIAALPPEETRRFVDVERKRRQELLDLSVEEWVRLLDSPEERERLARWRIALQLSSPDQRALVSLLGSLSPPQWALLREGQPLTLSTHPRPGELPLPAEIARTLRDARPPLSPPRRRFGLPVPTPEEERLQQAQALQEAWATAIGYRVTIRLDGERWRTLGSLSLKAAAAPLLHKPPLPTSVLESSISRSLSLSASSGDLPHPMQEMEIPGRDTALANDPVVGVRKPFEPGAKPRVDPLGTGQGLRWRLYDLLPGLARTYGVHVISDAYSHTASTISVPPSASEATALFTLLDRLAGRGYRWDHRGTLIRLRSRRWFLERPREVPLRFVRRWQAISSRRGALPMEAYLEMATALSDAQLEGLSSLIAEAGLPNEVSGVYEARHALRLYASLDRAQQQALWRGRQLPVAKMSSPQRDRFAAALRARSREELTPWRPEEWAKGSFALFKVPHVRVRTAPGSGTRYLDLPTPAPAALPAGALPTSGRSLSSSRSTAQNARPGHAIARVWLLHLLGGEVREGASITVAPPRGEEGVRSPSGDGEHLGGLLGVPRR